MYNKQQTHYRLTGTRRLAHTPTGTPESFKVIVSKYATQENFKPLDAMNTAREDMYSRGFEHILMTRVEVRVNNKWEKIPMPQALNLE